MMGSMPTPEGGRLRGTAMAAHRRVSAGSAADTTGTAAWDSIARRADMPRTGEETPTADSMPSEAATTGRRARPTTICGRQSAGRSSPTVATDPTGTAGPVKATAAGRAHPTTVRCRPIARRPQVFSVANSGDGLPGLLRAATFRTRPENHRTRVASICLVAGTLPRPLAAVVRAASTWEAAGIRRRASTAAEETSAGDTRTAEEVTLEVTAAASITAEAA